MLNVYIYVDDIRNIPPLDSSFVGITCRTYDSAIEVIKFFSDYKSQIVVDLDHDLGGIKTGYDVCKFLIENQIHIDYIKLHSMNPVGMQNMRQLLTHYGYTVI